MTQNVYEGVLETLAQIKPQLYEALREVDTEIVRLQEQRKEIVRHLKVVDPDFGKPKRAAGQNGYTPSVENMAKLRDWIEAHYTAGDEITATDLTNDQRFDVLAHGSVRYGLKALHEQGVLRMTRTGKGGKAFYTLTA